MCNIAIAIEKRCHLHCRDSNQVSPAEHWHNMPQDLIKRHFSNKKRPSVTFRYKKQPSATFVPTWFWSYLFLQCFSSVNTAPYNIKAEVREADCIQISDITLPDHGPEFFFCWEEAVLLLLLLLLLLLILLVVVVVVVVKFWF